MPRPTRSPGQAVRSFLGAFLVTATLGCGGTEEEPPEGNPADAQPQTSTLIEGVTGATAIHAGNYMRQQLQDIQDQHQKQIDAFEEQR